MAVGQTNLMEDKYSKALKEVELLYVNNLVLWYVTNNTKNYNECCTIEKVLTYAFNYQKPDFYEIQEIADQKAQIIKEHKK